MTGEKENRKYYQNTFHEVHASKHLLRKVEAMGKEYNEKKGRKILHKGCIAAAVLAVALLSSNIISYAATGTPWIITITTSDGRELPTEPGTYELEDGTIYTVKNAVEEETKTIPAEKAETEKGTTEKAETEKAETDNTETENVDTEASSLNSIVLPGEPQTEESDNRIIE